MATKNWLVTVPLRSVVVATLVLDGGDSSDDLEIPNFQDKTVHVFGTFGSSTVSVTGLNNTNANAQVLHRTADPTTTYSSLVAETLGHVVENPRYIRASASAGSGSGLTVVIIGVTPRS